MEYGDLWADLYDDVHTLTSDIPFWVGEAQASGGPVLDLACGTGRVAIPIAQAGVPVVGLDNSPKLLSIARNKARKLKLGPDQLRFIKRDMRRFSLDQRFSLVIIPFSSFQLLLSVADQAQCLAAIREHLAPSGQVIIDIFMPDLTILTRDPALRVYARERRDPETGRRLVIGEQGDVDVFNQIITAHTIVEDWNPEGRLVNTVVKEYQLRYIFRFEMQHLLATCGYEVEEVYGDYQGELLDESSARMIWVARAA